MSTHVVNSHNKVLTVANGDLILLPDIRTITGDTVIFISMNEQATTCTIRPFDGQEINNDTGDFSVTARRTLIIGIGIPSRSWNLASTEADSSPEVDLPVSIAEGGTGSSTAAGAPFALKGANSDITALTQAGVLSSGTEIYSGAGTFTATGNNGLISCSGGATATLNLPAYVVNRKLTLNIRAASNSAAGALTVSRQGSDLIFVNGSTVTSTTISSYQTVTFQAFDGSLLGAPGLTVWVRIEPAQLPVAAGGTGSQYYGVPYRGVSTNNYAITLDDYIVGFQVDTIGAGGAATIPSPATAPAGKRYVLHAGGNTSNTITITSAGNGFVNLNGDANQFPTLTLANNESVEIFGDSGYWRVNKTLPVDRGGTGLSSVGTAGQYVQSSGTALQMANVYETFRGVFDGGGSPLQTGEYIDLEVPFNCVLNTLTLLADQSGSVQTDLLSSTYASFPTVTSIVGAGTQPDISAAQKYQDTSFTSWTTTTLTQGDILRLKIDSNATSITKLTISLKVRRTA